LCKKNQTSNKTHFKNGNRMTTSDFVNVAKFDCERQRSSLNGTTLALQAARLQGGGFEAKALVPAAPTM
jgi:hypothetical protein